MFTSRSECQWCGGRCCARFCHRGCCPCCAGCSAHCHSACSGGGFLVNISGCRIGVKLVIAIVDVFSWTTPSITFTQLSWCCIIAVGQIFSTWRAIRNSYRNQLKTIRTGRWLFHTNPPTSMWSATVWVWPPRNVGPQNTSCTHDTFPRTAIFIPIDGQGIILVLCCKVYDPDDWEWWQGCFARLIRFIGLWKMWTWKASSFDLTFSWWFLFPSGCIVPSWFRKLRFTFLVFRQIGIIRRCRSIFLLRLPINAPVCERLAPQKFGGKSENPIFSVPQFLSLHFGVLIWYVWKQPKFFLTMLCFKWFWTKSPKHLVSDVSLWQVNVQLGKVDVWLLKVDR